MSWMLCVYAPLVCLYRILTKVWSTICQLCPRSVSNASSAIWFRTWSVRLVTELRKLHGLYSCFFLCFRNVFRLSLLFRRVCENSLVVLSFPSAVFASVPRDEFLWNFILGTFMTTCRQTPASVKIGPKFRTLCVKTLVRCIVTGDI